MVLPLLSGRLATNRAACAAAPHGYAAEYSFTGRNFSGSCKSIVVADGDNFVNDIAVKDGRDETGTNALDLMGPGFAAGQDRTVLWFYGNGSSSPGSFV